MKIICYGMDNVLNRLVIVLNMVARVAAYAAKMISYLFKIVLVRDVLVYQTTVLKSTI